MILQRYRLALQKILKANTLLILVQILLIMLNIILCAGLQSCNSDTEQNIRDEISDQKYELIIYDSLTIESNSILFLSDYQPIKKWYLFYDYFKGSIFIIDDKGTQVSIFNYKGDGSIGYNELRGLSFLGEDKIIAYGPWRYYIYKVNGEFIESSDIAGKSLLVNPQYDFKAHYFTTQDSTISFIIKGSQEYYGDALELSFYKKINWATTYYPVSEKVTSGVSLTSNSPYLDGFFYKSSPQFSLDKDNNKLFVLYPMDPTAYVYNLPDLSLFSTIPLKPDFFPQAKGVPFSNNKEKMKEESFKEAQLSGEYMAIQALNGNKFITYYRSGLPSDMIAIDMSSYLNMDLDSKRDYYIQILNENGKLSKDIKLPDIAKGLCIATSLDHVVLLADVPEELGVSTYLIARLLKIK